MPDVFTAAAVRNGSSYLGKHLTANDYYCKEETVLGQWIGRGAERLGIEGRSIGADDEAFERLRLNRNPLTDEPLTHRTKEDRIAFYDFQISAPKSVSIVAMTAGDERLIALHEECATRAFQTALEAVASRQDHAKDVGRIQGFSTTGNLVAARFTHHASRELDAQLHCHFVCANATFDQTANRWFALANHDMFKAVNLAGRLYQNELAKAVTTLGYRIQQDRDSKGNVRGFEIVGAQGHEFVLTAAHREAQSTRSRQIDAAADAFRAEKGYAPSPAERQVIARETRQKQLSEISTPAVIAKQRAKYSTADVDQLDDMVHAARVVCAVQTLTPAPALSVNLAPSLQENPTREKEAVDQALRHCLERHSVTTQKDVLAFALAEHVGQLDYGKLLAEVQKQAPVLEDKKTPLTVITSREHLAQEEQMVGLVTANRQRFSPIAPGYSPPAELGLDQQKAVTQLLESRDGVMALRGPAGTGKTTTLRSLDTAFRRALVEGCRGGGLEAVYVTPRHAAREVLIEDGFAQADTLAAILPKIEKGTLDLRGKILVVDEAGLLSSSEMRRTLAAADRAGARVLLVGDEKQLSAVDAGDALAMLRRHSPLHVVELTQIWRQESAGYRSAMESMSRGEVGQGLRQLDSLGLVAEEGPAYLENAALSYFERTQRNEAALLVAPTWAEIHTLNERVREHRKAAGELSGPAAQVNVFQSSNLTAAQREIIAQYRSGMAVTVTAPLPGLQQNTSYTVAAVDAASGLVKLDNGQEINVRRHAGKVDLGSWRQIEVAAGDRLLFQRSDRKHGLSGGKLATVEKVGEGGALTVSFAGKGRHFAVPAGYRCFVHGYAITADKSQGKTTSHVIVAGQRIDGKRLYVATSRGRKSVELHVPDKARLLQETPRQIENRPAALDFVGRKRDMKTMAPTQAPRSQESRVHVWAEKARQRCRRFLDLAQRWLRLEAQTLKESQAEERRRELERRIEPPIIQELQPQLELAQKHAYQQRHHARQEKGHSLGHRH